MAGLDNKISNIIGAALPPWLKKQLWTRYTENSLKSRNDANLIYLANKTAWIRVVSSVNINGSLSATIENQDVSLLGDIDYFTNTLGLSNIKEPQDLAKQYILFGGTSKYLGAATNKNGANYTNYELRSGIDSDGAYAMLGENEVNQYGYRPMPGIINAQIETQGRLGSVRMATINFKVWDKMQLDIIDTLYFKLGYTMLIEWGNTVYPFKKLEGDVQYSSTEFFSIDPFKNGITKEAINAQIAQNVRKSEGNYDGMLGLVSNFNFTFNQEGGYDCSIKVIGLGSLTDSIKINSSTALEEVAKQEIKNYVNLLDKLEAERIAKEAQDKQNLAEQQASASLAAQKAKLDNLPTYDKLAKEGTESFFHYIDSYGLNNEKFNYRNPPKSEYGDVYTVTNLKAIIASDSSYLKGTEIKIDVVRANAIYGVANPGSTIGAAFLINSAIKPVKGTHFAVDSTDNVVDSYKNTNGVDAISSIKYYNREINQQVLINAGYYKLVGVNKTSRTDPGTKNPITPTFTIALQIKNDILINGSKDAVQPPFIKTLANPKGYIYIDSKNVSKPKNSFVEFKTNSENGLNPKDYYYDPGTVEFVYKHFGPSLNNGKTIEEIITNYINDPNSKWNLDNLDFRVLENSAGLPAITLKSTIEFDVPAYFLEEHVDNVTNNGYLNTLTINKARGSLDIYLIISDVSLIANINFTGPKSPDQGADFQKNQLDQKYKDQITHKVIDAKYSSEQTKSEQIDSALKYQSNLELTLKAIEMHSLQANLSQTGNLIDSGSLSVISLTEGSSNSNFLNKIFSNGIYKEFFSSLISGSLDKIDDKWGTGEDYVDTYKTKDDLTKLKVLSKYGFASAILGGNEQGLSNGAGFGVPKVDYKSLLTSYVIPYNVNDSADGQVKVVHPVYIQLGFLLMIINDLCTIYESGDNGESKSSKPIVYIDYNPETNTCLSQPAQFSTNPFDFMIRNQCNIDTFAELFPQEVINKSTKEIIKSSEESSTPTKLFDPSSSDIFSKSLPEFRKENDYSGKHMKILVGIEYILSIIKEYTKNDGTNSVYLKQFLERICKDMNNYLGAINVFRVAYYDSSNTLCIVDDQIQPLLYGQDYVKKMEDDNPLTYPDELPVYGLTSIAKSINIQTEVSSKLGSLIAISANSDTKDQAAMGKNAGSFGFYNNSYRDRYIPSKTPGIQKTSSVSDSLISAANMFNNTIASFYGSYTPSKDNVTQATNFYIENINKLQNKLKATRASVMIPVSVNFTTDGIAGFHMGSAFSLPEKMLPYTYTLRQTGESPYEGKKVGFATVGLSHTISNNTWETSIKGQMIFLKDERDFVGNQLNSIYTAVAPRYILPGNSNSNSYAALKNTALYNDPIFRAKLKTICDKYKISDEDVLRVMYAECKLNPADSLYQSPNNKSKFLSHPPDSTWKLFATGLIQWTPDNFSQRGSPGPGYTIQQVQSMSGIDQLDLVDKYFGTYKNLIYGKSILQIYGIVFFPGIVKLFGANQNAIIQAPRLSAQIISESNPAIARAAGKNPGDPLTVADFIAYVNSI